ncbi:hypothetical protein Tco_0307707 [Tanacetum coccineum]
MSDLKFVDTHNMVVFLEKPTESIGFEEIVDFLNAQPIRYALTINPTIYTSHIKQFWATAKVKTVNKEVQIHALVDGKERVGKGFFGRVTPLFPTMMVQAQEGMGEGSANPTDPQHTPIIIQPSTSQPQRKQKARRKKRKATEIPQSSVPTDIVADKAVYEERDENLERAATIATSLDVEQDMGNINKTRSKATLNEPSSLGTSSGSGPRCQETIGDTIARTWSENVSKFSNDPLLAREVTLVDETQGRYGDDLVFETSVLDREEVFAGQNIAQEEVSTADPVTTTGKVVTTAGEVITTAGVEVSVAPTSNAIPVSAALTTTTTTVVITEVEITLAQILAELKTTKSKAKGIAFREPDESTPPTPTPIPSKIKDKGKAKMDEPKKPLNKKYQIMFDEELALKLQSQLQDELEEDERLARQKEEQANIDLIES